MAIEYNEISYLNRIMRTGGTFEIFYYWDGCLVQIKKVTLPSKHICVVFCTSKTY